MKKSRILILLFFSLSLIAMFSLLAPASMIAHGCGGSGGQAPNPSESAPPLEITISSFAFSPVDLQALPGQTVQVFNTDAKPHTITSENAPDDFVGNAGDPKSFDTGLIEGDSQSSFTVPAAAQPGDVLYYYCTVHKNQMATPNGTITIIGAAPSAGPPPSAPMIPGY